MLPKMLFISTLAGGSILAALCGPVIVETHQAMADTVSLAAGIAAEQRPSEAEYDLLMESARPLSDAGLTAEEEQGLREQGATHSAPCEIAGVSREVVAINTLWAEFEPETPQVIACGIHQ